MGGLLETTGSEPIVSACLRIDQWAAYGLGLDKPDDWIAWSHGATVTVEADSSNNPLPPILRRRVTAIGQTAFRTACNLTVPRSARFVFCSRHGEFQRTLRILTALAGSEPVSPAEFSLSVHNALAGLLSIAWHNPAGHTTIAAGADSFGSALIEAASCLMERPDEPVLLVYCDEPLPQPYNEIADGDETCVALAMLLISPQHDTGDVIFELRKKREAAPAAGSSSDQARAFLRFLLKNGIEERPNRELQRWRWRRA